jgi:hypothetical protein
MQEEDAKEINIVWTVENSLFNQDDGNDSHGREARHRFLNRPIFPLLDGPDLAYKLHLGLQNSRIMSHRRLSFLGQLNNPEDYLRR